MIMMTVSIVAYAVTPFSLMKSPSLCWRVASTIECIQQKKSEESCKKSCNCESRPENKEMLAKGGGEKMEERRTWESLA